MKQKSNLDSQLSEILLNIQMARTISIVEGDEQLDRPNIYILTPWVLYKTIGICLDVSDLYLGQSSSPSPANEELHD